MLKMQAILMAQRMPSRQSEATSGSSQSCSPMLNAASNGVHANYKTRTRYSQLIFYCLSHCNKLNEVQDDSLPP